MTCAVPVAYARKLTTNRKALMLSCAAAAMAAGVVNPQKAAAQTAPPSGAFQGTVTGSTGLVTRTPTSNTAETITIGTGTATINWSPTDAQGTGTINFLPTGNVATFTNGTGIVNFTVLNRIVPTDPSRAISLNGEVLARINDGVTTYQGGNIWFYSPGGILVGSTAVFDVGGLLLTTNNPTLSSASSTGFSASFAGTAGSTSSVIIENGARINATSGNNYVALIAPRVEQHGEVKVNGSGAYVGAEKLTMTMNQGLFDIAVDMIGQGGTSDANGVVHTGTTGGPASTGATDKHNIYMVGVPKNQALTMLLGGNVGFDAATVAGVENGKIFLRAGWNLVGDGGSSSSGNVNAGLEISAGNYTSDVDALTRGDLSVRADTGAMVFAGDAWLQSASSEGSGDIFLGADNGHQLNVAGNLTFAMNNPLVASGLTIEAQNGSVIDVDGNLNVYNGTNRDGSGMSTRVSAFGGSEISVAGSTYIAASVGKRSINPDTGSSDNFGADITIESDSSDISFGNLSLNASANGQDNNGNGDGTAGDGHGGDISLLASNSGSITVNGSLVARADGYGGELLNGGLVGGAGYGGSVFFGGYGGDISVTGTTLVTVYGIGGDFVGSTSAGNEIGGMGQGGYANVYNNGSGTITFGALTMRSDGVGGDGQTGGAGYGGNAGAYGYDGTINLGANTWFTATGTGGNASFGFGGVGGLGQGGTAYIEALAIAGTVETAPSAVQISGGTAVLDATGTGGSGGAGNGGAISAGAGGDGVGGSYQGEIGSGGAFAAAQNPGASLTLGNTTMTARGTGGAGGAGGAGQVGGAGGAGIGGSTQAGNYSARITGTTPASSSYGALAMYADAIGGAGGSGGAGYGIGGAAEGGAAFVNAKGATSATSLNMSASGTGGAGGSGGSGAGGYVQVQSFVGSQLGITGNMSATATGNGGNTLTAGGAGGLGTGGSILFMADSGAVTVGGTSTLSAGGTGGSAPGLDNGARAAGNGVGGDIVISAAGATGALNLQSTLRASASGFGGASSGGGTDGSGTGGSIDLLASSGGVASLHSANLRADGNGGAGVGGDGGDGTGGTVDIISSGTGSNISIANVAAPIGGGGIATYALLSAIGTGGVNSGGGDLTGGTGTGGLGTVRAEAGGSMTLPATVEGAFLPILVRGFGGNATADGGRGGDAYGGTINLGADGGTLNTTGNLVPSVFAQAGSSANANANITGGNAYGGVRNIYVTNGGLLNGSFTGGGAGAQGGNGSGTGNGGHGFGGTATLTVNGGTANLVGAGVFTGGTGGNGVVGGNATGGTATVSVLNGGILNAQNLYVGTDSWGGNGLQQGGNAQGGTSQIIGDASGSGATINVASGNIAALGMGGQILAGGAGTAGHGVGGTAKVVAKNANDVFTFGTLEIRASGTGGTAMDLLNAVTGGNGTGGTAAVIAEAGKVSATNFMEVYAKGTGGNGSTAGGNGSGGNALLDILTGGTMQSVGIEVNADGVGGNATNGMGGNAFAGTALVETEGSLTATGKVWVSSDGEGGDGTAGGGDGYGSNAAVRVFNGGSASLTDSLTVRAAGTGGSSTNGDGGNGYGGYARMSAYLGGDITANDVTIDSTGDGGDGVNGGDGIARESIEGWGGSVLQSVDEGSSMTLTGQTTVVSNGIGGVATGAGGVGGSGTGGFASVAAVTAPLTLGAALIEANGTGGTGAGGAGGGTGGNAVLASYGQPLTGRAVLLHADGSTDGGLAEVLVSSGGDLEVASLSATANGGSTAGDVLVAVGNGGTADLGTASLAAVGGDGTGNVTLEIGTTSDSAAVGGVHLFADDLTINSSGTIDVLSHNGAAYMVTNAVNATAQGLISFNDFTSSGPNVLTATSLNVEGVDFLFDMFFDVDDIAMLVHGDYDLPLLPYANNSLTITADGDITSTGGHFYLPSLVLDAGGEVSLGDLEVGGSLDINSAGNLTAGVLAAGNNLTLNAVGDISTANITTSGDLALSGNTLSLGTLISGGDLSLESVGSLNVADLSSSGDLSLVTAGDLSAGNLYAAGSLAVSADGDLQAFNLIAGGSVAADAGGSVTVGNVESGFVPAQSSPPGGPIGAAAVATGNDVVLTAGGDITTGAIDSAGKISIEAGGGISSGNLTAAADVSLTASSNIAFADIDAGGQVEFYSGGSVSGGDIVTDASVHGENSGPMSLGNITAGTNLEQGDTFSVSLVSGGSIVVGDITGPQSIGLATLGDLTTGAVNAGTDVIVLVSGDILIESIMTGATGRVYMADASMCAAGGGCSSDDEQDFDPESVLALAPVATGGSIRIDGAVSTGRMQAAAGSTLSVGNVTAGQSIELSSGGLASFFGLVSAPEINVASGDIHVALGASIGEAGVTEVLNLLAISDEPVMLGNADSGTETSYVLDEEGEIVATTVNFTAKSASGGADPDIRVGNLEIEGSQTAGGGVSHVNLATGGDVIVEGVIDYYNAAATDTFTITAGDTIQVITDTGGIGMTDSAGNLSGTLTLNADDVWVGDQALLNQLNADPNFAGRDAALATNNGVANPDGYVRAGGVEANVAETFFVQNSGTADNEGGITVGDGGLSVTNTGSSPATAVAYGRQSKSDGTVVTGDAFVQQVEFAGSGGFSSGSSVNGCPTSGCVAPPPPPPVEPPPAEPPPPPVTPPPVTPPPAVNPGVESILGPIGMMNSPTSVAALSEATGGATEQGEWSEEGEESEEEGKDNAGAIDASIGLINSGPVSLELTIDDPVTSGSDGPGI